MTMASNMSGALVTTGNEVWVDHSAESSFLNLSLAIEAAESHIHLEYYIFADDDTAGRCVCSSPCGAGRRGAIAAG
jgi:phosphatidylserine/phosphatidylglycerophosphate/cardiolipin synthase-like enzyme